MYSSTSLERLGFLVKQLQHRHHRALDARLTSLGIILVQWNALREVARHPGSSQHRLAEITFNSDQAFGTLLTRLLRLGLVERLPGAGHATVHHLTAKGETLLQQGHAVVLEVLAQSFAPLNRDERALLWNLLAKLLGDEPPDELSSTDTIVPW